MGTVVGIIAAVLVLVCLVFSGSRGLAQTPSNVSPGKTAGPPAATTSEKIKSLDRAEVRALLKKLADTPPPKERALGAMCYEPVVPPNRADYLCPKCGERTVYDDSKEQPDKQVTKRLAPTVAGEIPSCRRELKELSKLAGDSISLDESQFCRKCSPKVATPKLVLHISLKGEKPRDVEGVDHGDLRILREFLTGKLLAKGDTDDESPLKDHLPRLQELLGVKLDEQ